MGRRKREVAALQALARKVWGDSVYERHAAQRAGRRGRFTGVTPIALGLQFLAVAAVLLVVPQAAYAHTSAINISCTEVDFSYQSFAGQTTTAHESVTVDGESVLDRNFTFSGPQGTDAFSLELGSGTHTVIADDSWDSTDGSGSAHASRTLSDCTPATTTTTAAPATTSTTAAPATTSTTEQTTTTTVAVTTTTEATTSTTAVPATTTTERPTTTSNTPVTPLGSTSPPTTQTPVSTNSPGTTQGPNHLPTTGSDNRPAAAALAMVGTGLVAMGLGRRRNVKITP